MADSKDGGNTPLPKNVDLKAAINKYLPGLSTKVDDTFGILLSRKPDQVDDLTEISGIGPVNAEKLHNLGVYRYSQIASWSESVAAAFGEKLEFPGRIEREDWVPQAQALAKPAAPVAPAATPRSKRPELSDYDRFHNIFRDEPVKVDQDLGFVYTESYQPDDLTRIKGVGPVLVEKLNEAGIYRFKQVANWNQYNIEEFNERLDFPGRIEREEWIPQARRLMSEDAKLSSGAVGTGSVGAGTGIVAAGAAIAAGTTAMAVGLGNDDDTMPIDDDTTPIDDDTAPIAPVAPRKSDTSRVDVPQATPSKLKSDTSRMDIPQATPTTAKSDTSRINLAKAESGQINVEDDIFKAQTTPINLDAAKGDTTKLALDDDDTTPLDGDSPVKAALAKKKSDTSKIEIGDFSPDEDIFHSSTMPMDDILDDPKSATAQLQDADTVPMDEDAASVGIVPVPGIPDAGKSTTMAIKDVPNEGTDGKPKIKRPSQLKPKSIKRPPSVKTPVTESTGAVADAPKTVKLKRPGATADGDAPKTVKLKKAPAPGKDVTDSSKKTVKLQKRPAPTQGGLKLNKTGDEGEDTGSKKKKKKRKSRASMGVFWLILSLLTLLLAASGLMVLMNSAYPEDQNGNQALSMTFPLKGVDANIPFPKPKSTGPILPPVKPKREAVATTPAIGPDATGTATNAPDGTTTEPEPIAVP